MHNRQMTLQISDSFISKFDSKTLKGVAILMMVSMHLMKTGWINNPSWLIDPIIGGEYLSHILAESIHAAPSIFAFISGYVWARSYSKEKPYKRILSLYISFWLVTLIVNFPLKEINSYFLTGNRMGLSFITILKCVFALSSDISTYCWYIFFFALAVITFPLLNKGLNRIIKNDYVKIVLVIIVFLLFRLASREAYNVGIINSGLLGILSHYGSIMPSLMIGSVVCQGGLFDKWDKKLKDKRKLMISILFMIVLILFKVVLMFIFGMDSVIESVWIVFEIYSIVVIIKAITKSKIIKNSLTVLGDYSLYIWLIHAVFMLNVLQPFTYILRIPILIVFMVMILSLCISIPIKKLDSALKKALFRIP